MDITFSYFCASHPSAQTVTALAFTAVHTVIRTPITQDGTMKTLLPAIAALLLMGCASTASKPQTHSSNETISSLDYQACIQAAMSGNGQASDEKCGKVLKASR